MKGCYTFIVRYPKIHHKLNAQGEKLHVILNIQYIHIYSRAGGGGGLLLKIHYEASWGKVQGTHTKLKKKKKYQQI